MVALCASVRTTACAPARGGTTTATELTSKRPRPVAHAEITPASARIAAPLSFGQQRMWVLSQLARTDCALNLVMPVRLRGRLNLVAIRQAFGDVVARHDVLRAPIAIRDGEPVQLPAAHRDVPVQIVDLRPLPPDAAGERADWLLRRELERPFDLTAGLPIRVTAITRSAADHLIVVAMHHIATDGWSMGLLAGEITTLYRAFGDGRPGPLAGTPSIQYRDYARWQRARSQAGGLPELAQRLSGVAAAELPSDRPRPSEPRHIAATWTYALRPSLVSRLRDLRRREGGSLFMLVLTALMTVIYRLSGHDDVVVGTLAAGRTRPEFEPLIGYLGNVLVIPARFGAQVPFRDMWRRVREECVAAYARQDIAYEVLLERVRPAGAGPLVRVVCVMQQGAPELDLPGIAAEPVDVAHRTALFDITVELREQAAGLQVAIQYDVELFDAATIQLIGRYLRGVLESAASGPDTPCGEIALGPAAPPLPSPQPAGRAGEAGCIHELFEEQAARTPDAIAVAYKASALTYRCLNERANRLARRLQSAGAGLECKVGICLDRSPECVIALLAVLKAGAAYVPLDPGYPAERLACMLADAGARCLIAPAAAAGRFGDAAPPLVIDPYDPATYAYPAGNLGLRVSPDNLAYVMYTSGSTGRPKGVLGLHRGALNRCRWMWRAHPFTAGERCCQRTSLSFVDSVWEVFGALLRGVTTVVIDADTARDPVRLAGEVADAAVSRIVVVPSQLRTLLDTVPGLAERAAALRTWTVSGERLPAGLAARFHQVLPGRVLLNLYGSTEVAGDATAARIGPGSTWVTIGHPIDGVTATVHGRPGQAEPPLAAGELCVSGAALARGYHRRPGETAARFQPAPAGSAPGARTFRTGDRVRARPDGALEFLGRLDDQVKIRGYRVEPGEVEEALARHPAVSQAAVTTWPDGDGTPVLAGYAVLGTQCPAEQIRSFLRTVLPPHLVPSALVIVGALPLLPNGKIDRSRLPAPAAADAGPPSPPRTPEQRAVADVFAELLPIRWRSVHDDFFTLGGHSILATTAVHRLQQRCGATVTLRDLFDAPTIAGLAERIARPGPGGPAPQASGETFRPVVADPDAWYEPFPLTDVQQAYWIGRDPGFELGNIATHAYFEIDAGELDIGRLTAAVRRLVDRHPALRTVVRPDGTQVVLRSVPAYRIPVTDLRDAAPAEADRQLAATRRDMSHEVLPADRWPLFGVRATMRAGGRTRLHVSIDFLIADALSVQILMRELGTLYHRPEVEFEPLTLTFRDCVVAQLAGRGTPGYERSVRYWRARLAELPAGPKLPLARSPASVALPRFERLAGQLPAADWARLREQASRAGITPAAAVLAAFTEVLTAWSERAHYTLMLTLFNRHVDHPQVHGVIGDFTSLTLLEVDHRAGGSFLARARRLQERMWADLDHRAMSGVSVAREWTRLHGGRPGLLAPVVFTSNLGVGAAGDDVPELGERGYSVTQTPQLYLDHQVAETPAGLALNWDVVTELFPPGLAGDMFAAYTALLGRLAAEPQQWDTPVRGLLPAASQRRRAAANATATARPAACLHTLVADAARRSPDAVAVITPDGLLRYAEIRARAARVANKLRAHGTRRGDLVGVAMTAGWEQVVAVVGITACGAAYVPLDPELPAERLGQLSRHTRVRHILTQARLRGDLRARVGAAALLAVDDDAEWAGFADGLPEQPLDGDALAYVIFTSGSTGMPKGVMISHRGAVNTILDLNSRFGVGPGDRVLGLSSLSFDLSVYDIFGTLAAGGALVIPRHERRRDPGHWISLAGQAGVTVWNSVPALMGLAAGHPGALDAGGLAGLRLVLLSGDWIPLDLPGRVRGVAPSAQVVSLGGATEASIWSICHPIGQVDPGWNSVPYGRPLANQRMHVLDGWLEPRPDWVPGDLYIAGDGVALGYLRDPARTAQSFVPHPRTGERLYRTGDIARYGHDGTIEFLGRGDLQVKISGYRVELGEIEAALGRVPGVAACAVRAIGPPRGEKRLAAYYVPAGGARTGAAELRERLRAVLPGYLVPTTFTELTALPLSANGKVDRKALPDPQPPGPTAVAAAGARPGDELEESLARVWEHVLGVESVGPNDNFFELGGTSLVGIRLLAQLESALGVRIPLVRLFEAPTVAALAAAVRDRRPGDGPGADAGPQVLVPDPARRHEPFPLTDIQEAYWLGRRALLELGGVAPHSYSETDVRGLDLDRLERAIQMLVERHDALRTVVLPGGYQQVLTGLPRYRVPRTDLRDREPGEARAALDQIRDRMSHHVHSPDRWPLFAVEATRLPGDRTRLHVSVDLLVADAYSFRILQRELLALYQGGTELAELGCTFRDYVEAARHLRKGARYRLAETYWRERLAGLPPAPRLPLRRDLAELARPRFRRLTGRLDAPSWAFLKRSAAEHNLTPSGALCAAFADVLALWSQQSRFTVNLTTFNRPPLHPGIGGIVGDFTSTTLLAVDASDATFTARARKLQEQIFRDLEHRDFSGVAVLRLMRAARAGRRADVIAPVVFTSALVPEPAGPGAAAVWDAAPVYSVSQTPQVLLDHQVYEHDGELVYTWDHVDEAFPPTMIDAMFDAYGRLLRSLITDGNYWKAGPGWTG